MDPDQSHGSDEPAWNPEEMERLIMDTMDGHLKDKLYDEEQVPHWINFICESLVTKLNDTKKPFKYIVTCVIMQRNGGGLHSALSCHWDSANDGALTYTW